MAGRWFKIEVFLPEEARDDVMEALARARAGEIGDYDRSFTLTPVTGTFRPMEGAHPYTGGVGETAFVNEWKLEVNCREEYVARAVQNTREAHPYEEPVINVVALYNGEFGATQ